MTVDKSHLTGGENASDTAVQTMRRAVFSVDSGAVLQEAMDHFGPRSGNCVPGMYMGLNMIRRGLGEIALRAIELEDEQLMALMQQLCCVVAKESDNG